MKEIVELRWHEEFLEDVNKLNGFISKYKFKEAQKVLEKMFKELTQA